MGTQTMNPFHFDLALRLKNIISSFVSFKMQLRIKKVLNGNGKFGELQTDTPTGKTHTLYSLRHTAICMRIINSEGKVNIFNLAKNAGTSVDQIERFYARFLPLSKEMAKNLQSFGE